jgi:hypothetical protein
MYVYVYSYVNAAIISHNGRTDHPFIHAIDEYTSGTCHQHCHHLGITSHHIVLSSNTWSHLAVARAPNIYVDTQVHTVYTMYRTQMDTTAWRSIMAGRAFSVSGVI